MTRPTDAELLALGEADIAAGRLIDHNDVKKELEMTHPIIDQLRRLDAEADQQIGQEHYNEAKDAFKSVAWTNRASILAMLEAGSKCEQALTEMVQMHQPDEEKVGTDGSPLRLLQEAQTKLWGSACEALRQYELATK